MKFKMLYNNLRLFLMQNVTISKLVKSYKSSIQKNRDLKFKIQQIDASIKALRPPVPLNNRVFIVYSGKKDLYGFRVIAKHLKEKLNLEPIYFTEYYLDKDRYFVNTFISFAKDCSAAIILHNHEWDDETQRDKIMFQLGYFMSQPQIEKRVLIMKRRGVFYPEYFRDIRSISYEKSYKEAFWGLNSQFKTWNFPTPQIKSQQLINV